MNLEQLQQLLKILEKHLAWYREHGFYEEVVKK